MWVRLGRGGVIISPAIGPVTTHAHTQPVCMLFGGLKGTRSLQSPRESLVGPVDIRKHTWGALPAATTAPPCFRSMQRITALVGLDYTFSRRPAERASYTTAVIIARPGSLTTYTHLQTATSCLTPKPRHDIWATGNSPGCVVVGYCR